VLALLPPLDGLPIRLFWRTSMRAWRGRLLSGDGPGMEVHAASYIRRRRLVLDRSLLDNQAELARIVIHEIFHFAWVRLSNADRRAWESVLRSELDRRARGELGWSSEVRKEDLPAGAARQRTRRWREYACESFCDTAAWMLGGLARHPEFTLKPAFRARRARWLAELFRHQEGGLRI
jgi:hypothetical protein